MLQQQDTKSEQQVQKSCWMQTENIVAIVSTVFKEYSGKIKAVRDKLT